MASMYDCCKIVFKSEALVSIFEIILSLGNYMNEPYNKINYLFKISTLTTIGNTKSTKGTIINYIVTLINQDERIPDLDQLVKVKQALKKAKWLLPEEVSH